MRIPGDGGEGGELQLRWACAGRFSNEDEDDVRGDDDDDDDDNYYDDDDDGSDLCVAAEIDWGERKFFLFLVARFCCC